MDKDLQQGLETSLKSSGWDALVRRKKLAVCAVDLSSTPPRFARVNGNVMMYAASLPKIVIMLAVYASFEDGSLEESAEIHQDLNSMIRVSSNQAATRLLDAVGLPKLRKVVTDPRYGLYDEKRGGGLWVGKRYAKQGPRQGDPMHGISHGATATQVCRFYYLMATGRLINPARSQQMMANLEDPGLHHKFVAELDELGAQGPSISQIGNVAPMAFGLRAGARTGLAQLHPCWAGREFRGGRDFARPPAHGGGAVSRGAGGRPVACA